jgi:hypothetical protein
MTVRHVFAAALASALAASALLAQLSVLPPAKQAIEDQYTRERLAGNADPAPSDPNASFPIVQITSVENGIIQDCTPFPGQGFKTTNCWHGSANGTDLMVYAGSESEGFDATQGVVIIEPPQGSIQTIATPVHSGAVHIVAVRNGVLELVSATGSYVLLFNAATGTFDSVFADTDPPTITGLPPDGCSIWPPDHKMVQIALVGAGDAGAGVAPGSFQVSATSNEVAQPGETDIQITPDADGRMSVSLRADRLGTGNGRVYTVVATATDHVGNVASKTVTCTVPHDQGR